jgi:hypothetical protein
MQRAIGFLLFTGVARAWGSVGADTGILTSQGWCFEEIMRTENKDGVKLTLARTGKVGWDQIIVKSEIKVGGWLRASKIKGARFPRSSRRMISVKLQIGEDDRSWKPTSILSAKALKSRRAGFKVENRAPADGSIEHPSPR